MHLTTYPPPPSKTLAPALVVVRSGRRHADGPGFAGPYCTSYLCTCQPVFTPSKRPCPDSFTSFPVATITVREKITLLCWWYPHPTPSCRAATYSRVGTPQRSRSPGQWNAHSTRTPPAQLYVRAIQERCLRMSDEDILGKLTHET